MTKVPLYSVLMFAFVYVEQHKNQRSLLIFLLIALFPAHLSCKRGSQLKTMVGWEEDATGGAAISVIPTAGPPKSPNPS